MSEHEPVRVAITPPPSDREKAAISAAIVVITQNVPQDIPVASVNKWREAGKREALRDAMWEKSE